MTQQRPHLRAVDGQPKPSYGRVPPSDLDAEAAVLSAILVATGLDRVADRLKPEDFYADANGRIYTAALELREAGQPIDCVTVAGKLRDHEALRSVGGSGYIAQLADATPAAENLEAHADRVVEKARLRRMIATCQRIAAEGYGDVGEACEWLGAAEAAVCEASQLASISQLVPANSAIKVMFERVVAASQAGQKVTGTSTGFTELDKKLAGLHPKTVVVVAGRPGMGKSAFALNVAMNVAGAGHGVAIFSLEMGTDELAMRAVCSEARVGVERLRSGGVEPWQWTKITEATNWVQSLPLVWDDSASLTPVDISARVRRAKTEFARKGTPLKLVVVDYLQLINSRPLVGQNAPREQEVSYASRAMKQIAKQNDCCVMALSQLNRAVEIRSSKDHRPRLADLRESGAIEQDADAVLFVHRERYYNDQAPDDEAEIIIEKQRNGSSGCDVKVQWTGYCCRFDNPPPGWRADSDGAA